MTTPAGWYDDPQDAHAQRYWDGQQWTTHRQRKPKSTAPPAPAQTPQTRQTPQPAQTPPPVAHAPDTQMPAAPRVKSGVSTVGLVIAAFALVFAVAALVAGRVVLGSFLPGILLVAAIAIIAAFFVLRSHRSATLKAVAVTAIVLVVAVAVPASLKVVFPVYDHFLGKKSTQASPAGTAGSGSGAGALSSGPGGGAPSSGSGTPKSGILVMSGGDVGYVDPGTGKYTHISSFGTGAGDAEALTLSPDLTRMAILKSVNDPNNPLGGQARAGWIDTSGKFTAVSPAPPAATDFQQSLPPRYSAPMFDGAGNFYYWSTEGNTFHLYKVPAGSTSNAQEVTPTPKSQNNPLRNYDGTLNFGCPAIPGKWLGPDSRMAVAPNIGFPDSPTSPSSGEVIAKYPLTQTSDGCPWVDVTGQNKTKIFDLGIQNVDQPVASPDGTKIAFFNSNTPGGLYVVDLKGDGKATRIAAKSDLNFGNLKLIRWN